MWLFEDISHFFIIIFNFSTKTTSLLYIKIPLFNNQLINRTLNLYPKERPFLLILIHCNILLILNQPPINCNFIIVYSSILPNKPILFDFFKGKLDVVHVGEYDFLVVVLEYWDELQLERGGCRGGGDVKGGDGGGEEGDCVLELDELGNVVCEVGEVF